MNIRPKCYTAYYILLFQVGTLNNHALPHSYIQNIKFTVVSSLVVVALVHCVHGEGFQFWFRPVTYHILYATGYASFSKPKQA